MRYLLAVLVALILLGLQIFIGGAKLLYSEPAYVLAAAGAVLAMLPALKPRVMPGAVYVGAAIAFAVYVAGRAAASPVEYLARPDLFLVLACLAVYMITAYGLTDVRLRMGIVVTLLVFSVAHVLTGIVQFKEGSGYMLLPWVFRLDSTTRASGFYICPNHLAGLLELLGLFGLGIVCWSRWRALTKILAGYLVLVCYVGVAITGSRGGYLSTAFSLTAFIVLTLIAVGSVSPERLWKVAPFAVVGGLALVGIALLLMFNSDFLRWRVQMISETKNMRWLMWAAAMKQFGLNPIFGTGAGTYLYYGRQFRSALVQNDPVYVHNDYVHLLAEYGTTGAVLFLFFFISHLVAGFGNFRSLLARHLRRDPELGDNVLALHIGALCCVAAYVVHSAVDFNLHIPANAVLMAFVFGLIASPGVKLGEPARKLEGQAGFLRCLMPVVGILLVALCAPKWAGEYFAERARICLRDSMWPEAVAYAEGGIAVEKKNPNLYYYIAETQRVWGFASQRPEERQRLTEAAISNFRKGLELFPDDLNLLLKLGMALDLLQRFEESEPLYQKAMRDDPNFNNVYSYYGLHLQVQGRLDEAEELYRKSMKFGKNDVAVAGLRDIKKIREERAKRPKMMPEVLELFEDMR